MTRMRSWAGKIALLAFGVSFPLLAAEGVLRLMARSEPGGKEQVERNHYTESDPVLGWRKTPGAHATYVRRDYRVAAISGHFSIPFLDLTPALRDGARPLRPVYFSSDSHWNARGQAIAAEAVGAFLVGRRQLTCPVT